MWERMVRLMLDSRRKPVMNGTGLNKSSGGKRNNTLESNGLRSGHGLKESRTRIEFAVGILGGFMRLRQPVAEAAYFSQRHRPELAAHGFGQYGDFP
ncbi:hypothetical protein CU048_02840 [Beijerinckiaceae bacterium]|nr:hypothetical protein CU048_02840 [Beijerinckiaceae bacterium]